MVATDMNVSVSSAPGGAEGVSAADFWFDPACPWAWITSRWMIQVEQVRPVTTRWHVMSLAVLNDKPKSDPQWGAVRVLTAAAERARAAGDDPSEVLGRLYTEIGTRFHVERRDRDADTLADALVAAGLPAELADAAEDEQYDQEVVDSHARAIDLVGDEVGTPVISVAGTAFFGPVVTPTPRGEAAGRLWDGVLLVANTDGFFELKRSRTRPAITS